MTANDSTPSLGEFLRQERERRGITLEQVASATKISIRLLHSLEADHYAELPAKPFIRGFVTSYARFIGLDPKEVLTRFNPFIERKAHDRPSKDSGHSGYAFEKREGEQSRTILWVILGGFIVVGALSLFLKPSLWRRHHSQADKLRLANATPSSKPATHQEPPHRNSTDRAKPSPVPTATQAQAQPQALEPSPPPSPAGPEQALLSQAPTPVPIPSDTASAQVATSEPQPAATPSTLAPVAATHVTPSPTPTSTPASTPSPTPSPTASLAEKPRREDKINSGYDLFPNEIRHKLVVRALQDVWVRYQVDGKPIMQFPLRKDRLLVLRAKEMIRFQTNSPKYLNYNLNGSPSRPLSSEKNITTRQDTPTLIVPFDLVETIGDPFPGERPLPKNPPPPSPSQRAALPSPTPTP